MVVDLRDPRFRQPYVPPPAPIAAPRPTTSSGKAPSIQQLAQKLPMQPMAQQPQQADGGGWGRGLGIVINNPITRNILTPLKVLDVPRRAVLAGYEGMARALPQEAEYALSAMSLGLLAPTLAIDEQRSKDYEGGIGDRLWSDDTYGWGMMTPDTGVQWVDRAKGLAGDLAFDPLTYVGGIGVASKVGSVGGKGGRALAVARAVDRGADSAEAATVLSRGFGYASPEFMEKAGVYGGIRMNLPFARGGGKAIPGTEALTMPLSRARGRVGERLSNTALGRAGLKLRTPKGMEMVYRTLYQGSNELSMPEALEHVAMQPLRLISKQEFQGVAERSTREVRRELSKMSPQAKQEALRLAENRGNTDGGLLGRTFDWLWEKANEAGIPLPRRQNYTTHLTTREGMKWLSSGQDAATHYKQVLKPATITDLDESGVTMQRALTRGTKFKVGDTVFEITDDSISGLNAKIREAFGVDFDMFETDPGVILERYINMLSDDVGWHSALHQRAKNGVNVHQLTPEQMRLMGLQDDVPASTFNLDGSGKVQEGDLDKIADTSNVRMNPDVMEPQLNEKATKKANAKRAEFADQQSRAARQRVKDLHKNITSRMKAAQRIWRDHTKSVFVRNRAILVESNRAIDELSTLIESQRQYLATMSDRAAYLDDLEQQANELTRYLNDALDETYDEAFLVEYEALRVKAQGLLDAIERDRKIVAGSERAFADEVMQYATQSERQAREQAELRERFSPLERQFAREDAAGRAGVPEAQAVADEKMARLEAAVATDPAVEMAGPPPRVDPNKMTENARLGLDPGTRQAERNAVIELNEARANLKELEVKWGRLRPYLGPEARQNMEEEFRKANNRVAKAEKNLDKIRRPGAYVPRRIDQSFLDEQQRAADNLVAAERDRAAAAATATPKDMAELDRAVADAEKALQKAQRATERERERLRGLRQKVKADELDEAESATLAAERQAAEEAQPTKGSHARAKLTTEINKDQETVRRLQAGVDQIDETARSLERSKAALPEARKEVHRKLPTPKLADDDTIYLDGPKGRYNVVPKRMPNGETRYNVIHPEKGRLLTNHKSIPEAVEFVRDEVRQTRRQRVQNLEEMVKRQQSKLKQLNQKFRGAKYDISQAKKRIAANQSRLARLNETLANDVAARAITPTGELVEGAKRMSIRQLEDETRSALDEVARLQSRAASDPELQKALKRVEELRGEADRRIGLAIAEDARRPAPFDVNEFRNPETGQFDFASGAPGYLPEIQPGGWRSTPNMGIDTSRRPFLESAYRRGYRGGTPPTDPTEYAAFYRGASDAIEGLPETGLPDEFFISPTMDPGAKAVAQQVRESVPIRQQQAAERVRQNVERLTEVRRTAERAINNVGGDEFRLARQGQASQLEAQYAPGGLRDVAADLRRPVNKIDTTVAQPKKVRSRRAAGGGWESTGSGPIDPKGPKTATPWSQNQTQQQFYRDEVTKAQADIGESLNQLAAVVSDRGAADQALRDASDNVQKYGRDVVLPMSGSATTARSQGVLTGRNYGGGRPRPQHGKIDEYAYQQTQLAAAMKGVIEDSSMPQEAQAATAQIMNDALGMLDAVKQADLSDARWREVRSSARRNDATRVVNVGLQDGWEIVMPTVASDIVVSRGLRKSMQSIWQASNDPGFWPLVDGFTNLFKTYATMTPGFHVRNGMSAVFMNSSDNISVATQAEGLRLSWRMHRATKSGNFEQFLRSLSEDERLAIRGAFGTGIAGQFGERGVGDRASVYGTISEKAFQNWAVQASKNAGEFVEGAARIPVVLDSIRRGRKLGMDATEAMMEGVQRATYLHFDYSQVSQLDERMKRLIPFWTFMSRNLPLQVTQMWTKPRAYAHYNSLIRNVRGDAEPNTPEYFEQTGYYRIGDLSLGGLPLYAGLDLPHTRVQEDVETYTSVLSADNPLRVFSNFNPLFTAPAEYVTQKNFFTGREYDETDVRKLAGLEKALGPLAQLTGNGTDTGNGVVADERFIDAMRSVLPIYDRSVRLAPGITTGSKSEDAEARQLESYLRFFGLPVRQLSPQQQTSTVRARSYDRADELRRQRAIMQAANQPTLTGR